MTFAFFQKMGFTFYRASKYKSMIVMAFELAIINYLLAYDLLVRYSIHVIVHAIGCRNAFPFCFLFVE